MCRALNPYVTHVQSLMALPDAEVVLEKRLVIPNTYGMVWGTLDCGVYVPDHLHVVDLKFGKGVAVDPESPQLKLYALALAQHVEGPTARTAVTLTICQPRIEGSPLRSHGTTLKALREWRDDVVRPAVSQIKLGAITENAGAHCRWCVRKTECRAFAGKHQAHAAAAFDDAP
jgi:hypothetical protein